MSKELVVRADWSAAQIKWTKQDVEIIRDSIAKDLNEAQFRAFMASAKALNLNPLARQICPVVYKGRMSLQTEIAGYRVIAQRTGNYGGSEGDRLFVRLKDGSKMTVPHEEYDPEDHPEIISATIEVRFRDGRPNQKATALMKNYAKSFRNRETGKMELGDFWARMPDHMLLKCAEALALRKAFPGSYDGLYVREEMDESGAVDVEFKTVERSVLNSSDLKAGDPGTHSNVTEAPGPPPENGQKPLTDSDKADIRLDEICDANLPVEIAEYFDKKAVAKALIFDHYKVDAAVQLTDAQFKGLAKYIKSPDFLDLCRQEQILK